MTKLSKLEKVKTSAAQTAIEHHAEATGSILHTDALFMLGGLGAINRLSEKLAAQTIRALEAFGEAKGYESLGYQTMVEFLDQCPHSPLTKHQFYDRKAALEIEGDAAYDLLNSLGVPLSKRRLLTEGVVSIDGDTITVGLESARIDDRARITEIIRTLASKTAEQTRTIERGKKEHDNLKRKLDDAKKSAVLLDSQAHPFGQALLASIGALARLTTEARALDPDESLQLRGRAMELLAQQRRELEEAFRFDGLPVITDEKTTITDADLDDIEGEM